MSLQDDHFDLEDHFQKLPPNAHNRALAKAYQNVWSQLIDLENDNEKLTPVVNAVRTIVRHVIETDYQPKTECESQLCKDTQTQSAAETST